MTSSSSRYLIVGVLVIVGCSRGNGSKPDVARGLDTIPPNTEPAAAASATGLPASPGSTGSEGSSAGTKPQPLSDQQIAAITDGANAAEIEQAKVAEVKAQSAKVKHFAKKMIKHHGEARDKQAKLGINTMDSSLSAQNAQDAAATLAALKAAPAGADFDKLYMKDQVDEHQKVLDALDNQLEPNVKSASLKGYLDDIKPTVAEHLKDAREIERSLQSTTASNAQ